MGYREENNIRILFWTILISILIIVCCFENLKRILYFCIRYKNTAKIIPIPNANITDAPINSECCEIITIPVIIV